LIYQILSSQLEMINGNINKNKWIYDNIYFYTCHLVQIETHKE
jgi:hypothetical protein